MNQNQADSGIPSDSIGRENALASQSFLARSKPLALHFSIRHRRPSLTSKKAALSAEHGDENDLARPCAHAAVGAVERGELAGEDLHLVTSRPHTLRWFRRKPDDAACVRACAQSFDLLLRHAGGNLAKADDAEHAESSVDCDPSALGHKHESVSPKKRLNCFSRLDQWQEYLEAARLEMLSGEALALRLNTGAGPIGLHRRGPCQRSRLPQDTNVWSLRRRFAGCGRRIPLPVVLPAEALDLLDTLAAPLERERRAPFIAAVEAELEAAAAIGPGVVHQIGRRLHRAYFDPPHDARLGVAASRRV
jgi:hypothetical protein